MSQIFEYSSNNSGGKWWLKDKDWYALEKNGWKVSWKKDEAQSGFAMLDEDGRWLGALATRAQKEFADLKSCVEEWEKITGLTSTNEGCNCCGAPHTFYWGKALSTSDDNSKEEYGYASGEDLLQYLFPGKEIPSSIREALEK